MDDPREEVEIKPQLKVHGTFQARVLEWGAIAFSDTPMSKVKTVQQK